MDIAIPAPELDNETNEEIEPFPWATEIAKDLTLGATQTAGVGLGLLVVGAAFAFGPKLIDRFRKTQSEEAKVYNITDLPKTKEN